MHGSRRQPLPVQIQCTSVAIRNDALDRVLEGGADNFDSIAPNAMSYSDDWISQASFMSSADAEEFAKKIELRGLDRGTVSPDFVIVQSHDKSIDPPCDWLILFEYEKRLIATMRGSDSRTVIVAAIDANYDADAVQHFSTVEIAEKFEFVERKGSIDKRIAAFAICGSPFGYQSESIACDIIVKIVEQYLAEHREVFKQDAECQQLLLDLLGLFLGWPNAKRLTYRLEEKLPVTAKCAS